MKKCSKCYETKPKSEFGKHASKHDGLCCYCNLCIAAYRAANSEKLKTASAAWRAANPEKSKAASAAYRAANPEKAKVRGAVWCAANPEKNKARKAAWQVANPDKAKAASAAWRAENPDKMRELVAKWKAANPKALRIYKHNYRARKLENGGKLSKGLSDRLYKLQKGKCACCKQPLGENYHLDHIMPLALGGQNIDNNIQLLRQRCNNQKHAKHPIEFMQSRGFLL